MTLGKRNSVGWWVSLVVLLALPAWAQEDARQTHASPQEPPLKVEQVVGKLQEKNIERAAALHRFEGMRVYRMEYRGFPGDRDAEMVVKVAFEAPDKKEFTVVSQTGSKLILNRVFKKLLESEQEAMHDPQRTALSSQNYDFTMAGYESTPEGAEYVLNAIPKSNNKFLYRGKVWVDAKDFAVVKIEAEPAKNPSFWIKKSEIAHRYRKVDGFWLPAENSTESSIRLGGKAHLSIEYKDYKVEEAQRPVLKIESAQENAITGVDLSR